MDEEVKKPTDGTSEEAPEVEAEDEESTPEAEETTDEAAA